MTHLVIIGNVVQALFGPPITLAPEPAQPPVVPAPPWRLRFPLDAYQFASLADAEARAAELPGAVVVPAAGERVA